LLTTNDRSADSLRTKRGPNQDQLTHHMQVARPVLEHRPGRGNPLVRSRSPMSKVTHLASGALNRAGVGSASSYSNPPTAPPSSWWFGRRNHRSPRPHPKHWRRWPRRWCARWRRRRRNSPRRSGIADDRCRRALLALELTDAGRQHETEPRPGRAEALSIPYRAGALAAPSGSAFAFA
jgi:hypothetical protein